MPFPDTFSCVALIPLAATERPLASCDNPVPATTLNVVPERDIPLPAEYVVFVSVAAIVILSPEGVKVILDPATRVTSSVPDPDPPAVNRMIALDPLSTAEILYVVLVSVFVSVDETMICVELDDIDVAPDPTNVMLSLAFALSDNLRTPEPGDTRSYVVFVSVFVSVEDIII